MKTRLDHVRVNIPNLEFPFCYWCRCLLLVQFGRREIQNGGVIRAAWLLYWCIYSPGRQD
jgi:hypothetical protein